MSASSDRAAARPVAGVLFLLTVFLSAFLLFQVQPLISRYILPWFGGSPAVWTTCMLFFQVTLFAGYVYAHLLVARLSPVKQTLVHALVLGAACLVLPIAPDTVWKPVDGANPAGRILLLLAATVGLPYFALSATGPLLQGWFLKTIPGKTPWRLYALSNAGSLLALLSYPFVVEPQFTTQTQAALWSWGFGAFAAGCVLCAIVMSRSVRPLALFTGVETSEPVPPRPGAGQVLLWLALAAAPCVMLLATTTQVCTDIASVPFLWVLPLSLYLLTFILCFDSDRWYQRRLFAPALFLLAIAACALLWDSIMGWRLVTSITAQAAVFFGLMFCACMVCHGELVRLKPHPQYLTLFYLTMSAGGALGGVFVGIVAPSVFHSLMELPLGIIVSLGLLLIVMFRDEASVLYRGRNVSGWTVLALLMVGISLALQEHSVRQTSRSIDVARNFYGVLRVDATPTSLVMKHGSIRHGHQFRDPERRRLPTTYFSPHSGVGLVLRQLRPDQPRQVGVIGLGAGTLAAYAQPGDRYRMYEINPAVETLARKDFTYLSECEGRCDVVIGDGRIALERETPNAFDVLVLDAFSGDAIPTHLLTRECFELYLRHLRPDGVLALHITNRHVDLRPVCRGLAEQSGLTARCLYSPKQTGDGSQPCFWFLMSREPQLLAGLELETAVEIDQSDRTLVWTDDWTNLLTVMRPMTDIKVLARGTAKKEPAVMNRQAASLP